MNRLHTKVKNIDLTTFMNSGDYVYYFDRSLACQGANDNIIEYWKLQSPKDIVGKTLKYLANLYNMHEQTKKWEQTDREVISSGRCSLNKLSEPIRTNSTMSKVIATSVFPLADKHGECLGIVGVSNLITPSQNEWNQYFETRLKTSETFKALTRREKECLEYMASGRTAQDISHKLGLSRRTVEYYLENVKDKFGAGSKSELLDKLHGF